MENHRDWARAQSSAVFSADACWNKLPGVAECVAIYRRTSSVRLELIKKTLEHAAVPGLAGQFIFPDTKATADVQKSRKRTRPDSPGFTLPPGCIEETADLRLPGELEAGLEADTKPVRYLDSFTIYDPRNGEFRNLADLESDDNDYQFEAAGFIWPVLVDEDEDDSEDEDEEDEEPDARSSSTSSLPSGASAFFSWEKSEGGSCCGSPLSLALFPPYCSTR